MHIVIAGGGLVGLTTAAALRPLGHEVTVLEQATEIRAAGAGIGLWENALRVFDEAGIGAEVRGLGQPVHLRFFDPSGKSLRAKGYGDSDHEFRLVPRPALNTLLAGFVGPDRIRLSARVTGFEERDHEVVVHLGDGGRLAADLLIGADGVHSPVRAHLLPGSDAQPHGDHYAWRAIVPSGDEKPEGTVVTIGPERTRGGYTRVAEGRTMWMVNQFEAGPRTGGKRDRALARARHLAGAGWHGELLRMIAETPEAAILENRITLVPPLPRWTGRRVALIGDAAHGLSPHIAAGGTLGIEDAGVLRTALKTTPDLTEALKSYEQPRMERFERVRKFSADVETVTGAAEFAERYAAFSHWMLTTTPLGR
ncbi:FAD-dependent monooxygenase [Amycolatopsis sp. PS_44_ISF1]|uniref:FAD-dependent oxidoreductase n=1 Tax=Amycolatopsis sp. PS_44_ISF1 TaxID=2974917 RepID=UPI0028DE38D7|nr:FAD-dependent monooxygenase [Amycolatopsis sp. PS_44_ISF1]MDT8911910.1 FAD-dependent monooxygenase [Amycolatopsis sp. PS_44_ISF1]